MLEFIQCNRIQGHLTEMSNGICKALDSIAGMIWGRGQFDVSHTVVDLAPHSHTCFLGSPIFFNGTSSPGKCA